MVFEVLFWLSVLAVFHTYVLYPFLLKIFSSNKPDNTVVFPYDENLPFVSILISVFNEQEVIVEKVESIYNTNYPVEKFELIIGSDASTDNTNSLLDDLSQKYHSLHFFIFKQRQGKGNIINQLFENTKGKILILTDANVIFETNTIYELVKHFKNKDIGLVDTNMINKGLKKEGISIQENAYLSREVIIKNQESRIWGTMMGPFGGCYAIRKELYSKVPENYLVDDFYINMKVFEKQQKAINNLNAKVYEHISSNLKDEFRRKVRIATGNFQNLYTFAYLLLTPFKSVSFCFLSHKVLRWLGPFFLIIAFISNIFLLFHPDSPACQSFTAGRSGFYKYLFYFQCFVFILPVIDYLLRKFKIHIVTLRFITHFYSMNLALLFGFINFLKGVETNVWKPTKRNQ